MSDNIINIKEAIWDFIATQVTDTSNGFSQYFTSIGSQIYWEWTKSVTRDIFPYIFFEIENIESKSQGTFHSYNIVEGDTKKIYRVDKEFNIITIGINVCTMSDGTTALNGINSQNLGNLIIKLLKRKLKSQEAIVWFSEKGNKDAIEIGIFNNDISSILYLPEYEDTRPRHRYRFTCQFNWLDSFETELELGKGAKIDRRSNEVQEEIIIIP